MINLATWLAYAGNHHPAIAGSPDWRIIRSAAQKLEREVWDQHRVKLMLTTDVWRFHDLSSKEVERANRKAMGLGDASIPQLGMHADPTCRNLTPDTFYALIGTKTDRPLPALTFNTAVLYRLDLCSSVAELFTTKLLWSDFPERDCAGWTVEVRDAVEAVEIARPSAVHLGTAWRRDDLSGNGLGGRIARLHRLVAYLRYGTPLQFATILPGRNHDKVFQAKEVGTVIERRPSLTVESRLLTYTTNDLLSDAISAAGERV
jgi:hypothetical protein